MCKSAQKGKNYYADNAYSNSYPGSVFMCQAMLHTLPHLDIIHLILYKVRAGESAHQHHTVDDRTRICTCV